MFKHDFGQNGIFKKFSGAPVNPLSATDVYTRFDPPKNTMVFERSKLWHFRTFLSKMDLRIVIYVKF